jgi:hypothetical protein
MRIDLTQLVIRKVWRNLEMDLFMLECEMTDQNHQENNTNGNENDARDHESYDTNHLLDSVLDRLHLENDSALCDVLGIAPSVISDIRHMRQPVDAAMLVRLHELTDISISGLRNILGDRREKSRFCDSVEENHN